MDFLTDWLTDWLKELLIGGIMGNLEGLFDYVNTQVGEIAVQVGTTPAAWNAGVFSLIRQLSETVIPKSERSRYRWGLPRRRGTPGYFPSSASFPKR